MMNQARPFEIPNIIIFSLSLLKVVKELNGWILHLVCGQH
jgi:hypothetical protein